MNTQIDSHRTTSFVHPDGSILQSDSRTILAIGQTAIILHHPPHALKIPKIRPLNRPNADENHHIDLYNNGSRLELANEQAVYRRLGHHPGIAHCINISPSGTLLTLYPLGTLENFIRSKPEVPPALKTAWILSLIGTHLHFHNANILVNDFLLRNILVADDLSLKMIDFGKCRLLPADTNMDRVNDRGMSARVEMFHLGSVFYAIATWTNYEWGYCSKEEKLPAVEEMPEVGDRVWGDVVRKCWGGGYGSLWELYDDALERLSTAQVNRS